MPRLVALGLAAALLVLVPGQASAAPATDRLAGPNRYATSVAISQSFPAAEVVYVATGRDFPDALAGGAAAAQLGGPLLLVDGDNIPAVVDKELARLRPDRIVVLGSHPTVTDGVVAQLGRHAASVVRAAGNSRYATAVEASKSAFPGGADTVILANGMKFPDALSGGSLFSALGGPILLSSGVGGLDAVTLAEVKRLKPSTVYLLGTAPTLPEAVANQVAKALPRVSIQRLGGPNRYATSVAIAKEAYPASAEAVYLTTGLNFPDGLSVGPLASLRGGPVLLTDGGCLIAEAIEYINAVKPARLVLLGSSATVPDAVTKLSECATTSTTAIDVGTLPEWFYFDVTNNDEPGFWALQLCPDGLLSTPSLAWRTASRFVSYIDDNGEHFHSQGAMVFTTEARARQFMKEMAASAAACKATTSWKEEGMTLTRTTKRPAALYGNWDEAVATYGQFVAPKDFPPFGDAYLIARRGNLVVADSNAYLWWEPNTYGPDDGMPTGIVETLLRRLEPQ